MFKTFKPAVAAAAVVLLADMAQLAARINFNARPVQRSVSQH